MLVVASVLALAVVLLIVFAMIFGAKGSDEKAQRILRKRHGSQDR